MQKGFYMRYWLSFFLSRLISRGIPLLGVIYIYGLFEPQATQDITGMAMFVGAIIVFLFFKDLKEQFAIFASEKFKKSIPEVKALIVFGILFLFIQIIKTGLGNLELLIFIILVSLTLSLPFEYWHRSLQYEYKEAKGKNKE